MAVTGTVAGARTDPGALTGVGGAINTLKLLEVTDGKPTWRRDTRGPPVLAKDATWSEAAVA